MVVVVEERTSSETNVMSEKNEAQCLGTLVAYSDRL